MAQHDSTSRKKRSKNKRHSRRNRHHKKNGNRKDVTNHEEADEFTHNCVSLDKLFNYENVDVDVESINKLKSDIMTLKSHLTSAYAELLQVSLQNAQFKKTMNKYKQKLSVIDKLIFGSDEVSSESAKRSKSRKRSRKSKNKKKSQSDAAQSSSKDTNDCTQNFKYREDDDSEEFDTT